MIQQIFASAAGFFIAVILLAMYQGITDAIRERRSARRFQKWFRSRPEQ